MRRARTTSRSGGAVALLLGTALVGCACACGGGCGGGGRGDAATDGGESGPPPCTGPTGCGEVCELGNSWGVGRYCTPGGGECLDTASAPFCTVDQVPAADAFCTRPCSDESQCGENARCVGAGGGGPMGCVPFFCLDQSDAATPATDAAATDAG